MGHFSNSYGKFWCYHLIILIQLKEICGCCDRFSVVRQHLLIKFHRRVHCQIIFTSTLSKRERMWWSKFSMLKPCLVFMIYLEILADQFLHGPFLMFLKREFLFFFFFPKFLSLVRVYVIGRDYQKVYVIGRWSWTTSFGSCHFERSHIYI